jgi:hypothetical protein
MRHIESEQRKVFGEIRAFCARLEERCPQRARDIEEIKAEVAALEKRVTAIEQTKHRIIGIFVTVGAVVTAVGGFVGTAIGRAFGNVG